MEWRNFKKFIISGVVLILGSNVWMTAMEWDEDFLLIYIILCALGTLLFQGALASLSVDITLKKGYSLSEVHPFALCFGLGLFGWAVIAALPDLSIKKTLSEIKNKE